MGSCYFVLQGLSRLQQSIPCSRQSKKVRIIVHGHQPFRIHLPCFLFFLFLARERGTNGERPQTLHCYFLCSPLRCCAAMFNSTQHSPLRILQSCRADNLTSSLYYSLCNIHLHTLIFYFVLIFILVLIFTCVLIFILV